MWILHSATAIAFTTIIIVLLLLCWGLQEEMISLFDQITYLEKKALI